MSGERGATGSRALADIRRSYLTSPLNHAFLAHAFKAAFKQHHQEDLPVLRRVIPRDGVVLDVGAHAGQYTKLFAGIASEGFVLAVEPGSYARTILRVALTFNRIRNVAVLPMALGERAGVMTLTMPLKRSGGFGFGLSHLGAHARPGQVKTEVVAVATLDEVAASLDLPRLDFIKADIEGWECHLLRGARRTLERLKPTLFLEMNAAQLERAGDSLESAWALLTGLGYRPHSASASGEFSPIAAAVEGNVWWLPPGRAPIED